MKRRYVFEAGASPFAVGNLCLVIRGRGNLEGCSFMFKVWSQAWLRKSQYFVAGADRRLPRSIDEILSDDAVRVRYELGKEWRDVRVRSAVGQFARDEAVSKCRCVRCKALRSTDFVSFESISEYRQVFSIEALANGSDLIRRYFQLCWLPKW
jgi:hypothetical protein